MEQIPVSPTTGDWPVEGIDGQTPETVSIAALQNKN